MPFLPRPAPHSIAESLREGQPIVIILSDQTFPPVLPPTGDSNCTVIIRVEDCELWEPEEVFLDRFRPFCKPHGSLPSGSVILVGSMSHLAKNGLNFYALILVETMTGWPAGWDLASMSSLFSLFRWEESARRR
jgi:hypothetical protein